MNAMNIFSGLTLSIPSKARKLLSSTNTTSPEITILQMACKKLKLSFKTPFWIDNAVAHLAIPSKKIAMQLLDVNQANPFYIESRRQEWNKEGWHYIPIQRRAIQRRGLDGIVLDLKEIIRTQFGVKSK